MKIGKFKMEEKANELSERLLDYGVEIVKLTMKLRKTSAGRQIANQLLRCGTSVGANYEEACGAQSRADFIHKLQIVLKEIRESLYWLRLIKKSAILKEQNLIQIVEETKQLSNIIAKSIITAKKRK
ncbi:four helix bundle protein [Candidatus Oleimmundimicrobium sp.]|uniref:four helix bundle protein n=1 Tax=Candidatus Oleimmundimicrobium sp. TaxID=3060597 RepID=UPI00271F5CA6|nr:four helix bundle protein [Candidatus Oleimmundimicrobium sp.]MDO8886827.1 four helix bundle protein [Candidatus Oleimmundimicrobium sp.]